LTDGLGYQAGSGTGAGKNQGISPSFPCSGGGHGGYGANSVSNSAVGGISYDSSTTPGQFGSGGGTYSTYSIGGAGGGYVRLSVNNLLRVDGIISANGGNGAGSGGGGGAGGSISLSAGSLAGAGAITANGGSGAGLVGGGGGGGRIAITYSGNYYTSNSFSGTISTVGGGGANWGGAGTYYFKTNSQPYASLILDNGGNVGAGTTFDNSTLDATMRNGAIGTIPSGSWNVHNLFVRSNAMLTMPVLSTVQQTINSILGNVTIDAGGSLNADGDGFAYDSGNGRGFTSANFRGGGGHGGYGGGIPNGGGGAYDSIASTSQPGSGGASYFGGGQSYSFGGLGGGALRVLVNNGTLTVNGNLSANGTAGGFSSGGGSGGSLSILASTLAGSGIISANGGAGNNAGGGGGGRVYLNCIASNGFTGNLSATGGNGLLAGGAGTIYTTTHSTGQILINNGGLSGTNTPLSSAFGYPATPPFFNLTISGGATALALTPLPLVSNLTVGAGSSLSSPKLSSLFVAALQNVNIQPGGAVIVDNGGYALTNGPGAGNASTSQGSGGGYGGAGGASASGATGGLTYGSATQPVDFGSGGGNGTATVTGGSDGGGVIRFSVGGNFNVDGSVSANGNSGWQDNSGGGAGGSIWVTANSISGSGSISAAGGNGNPYNGGGGGGGRIALYTPTNNFIGQTNLTGGAGAASGQPGTLYLATSPIPFLITSQSPPGVVYNTVSYVTLYFNDALSPTSVNFANFSLLTPAGPQPVASLSANLTGANSVLVGFPVQNLAGNYSLVAGTSVANIFGQPLSQAYTGAFTIVLPIISGSVTDTNGAGVPGVSLQADGGLPATLTDTNGNYSIGVPPGWSGNLVPSFGSGMFVPALLAYTNVTANFTNQNFLLVATTVPTLNPGLSGTNLLLNWSGIPGIAYQVVWSTDLVNWQPLGSPVNGTNGPMQIALPVDNTQTNAFFRLQAIY
jgi:hypothetical protein